MDGPVAGASIADWFKRWKSNDLNRIAQAVQRGAIEELSVDEVAANVWNACNVSRNSARTVARTIINGVSNAARAETLFANEDAIDGIEFLATLDARTSHICGALDGTVWGADELDQIRRPPLRVSCRCCVVPHVVLNGPDGKVYEIGNRPAANADFDALAKEAYNKAAREKRIKRRWDDLSPSTRLKYYYQAQKDFEKRTGKPAYRQVSPSTTFAEYFERQDDAFKRSWLGAKRYEAYRNGAKFGDLVKPAATYRATLPELSQTPGNGPISPSNAPETPTTTNIRRNQKRRRKRQKSTPRRSRRSTVRRNRSLGPTTCEKRKPTNLTRSIYRKLSKRRSSRRRPKNAFFTTRNANV